MTVDVQRWGIELRAEVSEAGVLTGHAAVFDQVADLGRDGLESIARTAFDRALADPATDVRALINHDPNQLLGRQSAGTLRLQVDRRGLAFEVDLPDTSYANDLRALVRRGDVDGGSFGVIPDKIERNTRLGRTVRTHTDVARLVDVSVVTWPAYSGTGVQLRSASHTTASYRSRLVRARAAITLRSDR